MVRRAPAFQADTIALVGSIGLAQDGSEQQECRLLQAQRLLRSRTSRRGEPDERQPRDRPAEGKSAHRKGAMSMVLDPRIEMANELERGVPFEGEVGGAVSAGVGVVDVEALAPMKEQHLVGV